MNQHSPSNKHDNITSIIIAHSWSDVGVNIQTTTVAKKLSETKKVLFLTQSRIGAKEKKINERLTVAEWPNKRPNGIKDFFFLCKKIWKEKPQAVIVHFGATNVVMLASWVMRVKYRICWMHTLSWQFKLDTNNSGEAKKAITLRRRAYKLSTHVAVLNEFSKTDAIENFGVPEKKLVKIFNGIYPAEVSKEVKQKKILYAGRIDNSKGIDVLITAFVHLLKDNPDVILEIAGKGKEEEKLKAFVKENDLEKNISFLGFFSDYAKIRAKIADALFFVLPSNMDNFPTVILECMSCGTPVIASNAGGIPEMIENKTDGLLFETGNVAALLEQMKLLLNDDKLRESISMNAQKSFNDKFHINRHVENVVRFINGLD